MEQNTFLWFMHLTSLWFIQAGIIDRIIFHSVYDADENGNDEHRASSRGECAEKMPSLINYWELFLSGISHSLLRNRRSCFYQIALKLFSFSEFFMRNHLIKKSAGNWKIVCNVSALVMELCIFARNKWQQIGVNLLIYICPIRGGIFTYPSPCLAP